MKFWYQTMTDIERYPSYRAAIQGRADEILEGGEIDLHGVAPGTYGDHTPVEVLAYPGMHHGLLGQVVDNVRRAEREGYDGVILGSWSEPFLRESRSLVDITVTSMAESTLLVGCAVAGQIGLVTVAPGIKDMALRIIAKHRMQGRVAAIEVLDPPVDEDDLAAAMADPTGMLARFDAAARRVMDAGADVVIPAEGVLSELVALGQLTHVGPVSVMDCVAVTMMHAQMMVRLRHRTGLTYGRLWEYPRPPEELRGLLDVRPVRS